MTDLRRVMDTLRSHLPGADDGTLRRMALDVLHVARVTP